MYTFRVGISSSTTASRGTHGIKSFRITYSVSKYNSKECLVTVLRTGLRARHVARRRTASVSSTFELYNSGIRRCLSYRRTLIASNLRPKAIGGTIGVSPWPELPHTWRWSTSTAKPLFDSMRCFNIFPVFYFIKVFV